jgi:hypothetical protein
MGRTSADTVNGELRHSRGNSEAQCVNNESRQMHRSVTVSRFNDAVSTEYTTIPSCYMALKNYDRKIAPHTY